MDGFMIDSGGAMRGQIWPALDGYTLSQTRVCGATERGHHGLQGGAVFWWILYIHFCSFQGIQVFGFRFAFASGLGSQRYMHTGVSVAVLASDWRRVASERRSDARELVCAPSDVRLHRAHRLPPREWWRRPLLHHTLSNACLTLTLALTLYSASTRYQVPGRVWGI
jgi:hypothetical protein